MNNAGYGTRGPVELVPVALIRRNFETNLFALIALTQLVVPHLRAGGSGRIINIGSVAGRIARPLSSVYDATKHALEAVTDGLRGELKPFGIEVVLIRPGFIRTEFVDAANSASEPVIANAGPYAPYFEGFRGNYRRWLSWAGGPDDIARLVEKAFENDDAQLCAQALCLEEMFRVRVERGAVFHAASKRRREVEFTAALRKLTEEAIAELHRLVDGFQMSDLRFQMPALPPAVFKPACEECSLYEICLPQLTGAAGGVARAARRLFEI